MGAWDVGEQRAAERLRAARPELVAAFLAHLPHARASVLERLVGALVREGTGTVQLGGKPTGACLATRVRQATATGRLVVTGPVVFLDDRGVEHPITHPVRAWRLLTERGLLGDLSEQAANEVEADLADSVCQTAIALVGAARRRRELNEGPHYTSILAMARGRRGNDPSFSPLAFFEQWVIDGHPTHFGAKIRRGLSVDQAPEYAPEWGACFTAPLVAVARSHVLASDDRPGAGGVADQLAAEHPNSVTAARAELRDRGLDPADYELIPAHPWQVRATLPRKFARQLAEGTVIPLAAGIAVRPSMSFRTLAPVPTRDNPFPSHLKTAVDLRLTMAVRGVSPHAVENGPLLTALLTEILDREGNFAGRLAVQEELVAACFLPRSGEDEPLRGSLGAIVRANPETDLADGELALPVAALYSASPLTDELIVADVLDELAEARHLGSRAAAAALFVAEYARLTLPPLLTLLTRYGVALEAHPQNTVLVLNRGTPTRLLVRDFGGVRILSSRLATQNLSVSLRPGSAVLASGARELRDKLHHALVTNHLGELLAAVGEAAGISHEALWAPFSAVTRETFDTLPDRAAAADRRELLDEALPVKAFLRMRLAGAVTDSMFVAGPNPLSQ